MRVAIAAVFLALLAACGPSSPSSTAPVPTPQPSAPDAAKLALVAALAAPYNEADYEAGRREFGACRSCHTITPGGPNILGPNLNGVFGRPAGGVAGFAYSPALSGAGFTWDGARLDSYVADPRGYLPGNRMSFAGVRNAIKRRDLIAYLMVESAPAAE